MLGILCAFILPKQVLSGEQTGLLLCQAVCWVLGRCLCEAASMVSSQRWLLGLHNSQIISLCFALHPLGCRISPWWWSDLLMVHILAGENAPCWDSGMSV